MRIQNFSPILKQYNLQNNCNNFSLAQSAPKIMPLSKDTVSFGGSELLENSEDKIIKKVKSSINRNNIIGEGGEATVYKIGGTNYCFRHVFFDDKNFNNISFNLSEQDKINHIVAKVGNNGSAILKYIEGTPVYFPNMDMNLQREIADEISNMPVESFNKLIKQVGNAYNHQMVFDCCSANIIVNGKDKTLVAIDFYKAKEMQKSKMLDYLYKSLKNPGTTTLQERELLGKMFLAAIQEFEPNNKPCTNIENFDFELLCHDAIIPKYEPALIKAFEKLKITKRFERLNPQCKEELKEQIKIVKAMVTKLFFTKHILLF